jgi:hypothetical protein
VTGIQRLLAAANGKSLSVAVVATAKGYVATPNPRPHVHRIEKFPAPSVLNGTGSYGWERPGNRIRSLRATPSGGT